MDMRRFPEKRCGASRVSVRRGGMSRFCRVAMGWAIIGLCVVSPPTPESPAENRECPEGVFSCAATPSIMTGVRLAKSGKRADVREENETWRRREEIVVSGGDEPTKVQIRGNRVFVPVTLVYGSNEMDLHLLLDTGATGTTIHTDIADRLSIKLSQARKAKVQVVGGAVIEVHVARINSLTVGPHTKRNWEILVVPHKGAGAKYDGLLGMDVLRGMKYKIDYNKQVIIWE